MKLYNFFLFILSFVCTLSSALPANGQCAAIRSEDAPLRNMNGAGISLFENQVRINIAESYVEPSERAPTGGFTVSVHNDHCTSILVVFRTPAPDARSYQQVLAAGASSIRGLIPRIVERGAIIRVTILDRW
jgi:hypothetical protein